MRRSCCQLARIVVGVAVVLSPHAGATAPQQISRFEALVETARQELQESHTPGAAIAVVDGDRVVFTAGVGVADAGSSASVQPEMLFRLGSTTKMFTATALVTLAEEGRLSLDMPIGATVRGLDPAIARLNPQPVTLAHGRTP